LLLKATTVRHFAIVFEITSVRVHQIQQQAVRETLASVSCQDVRVCGEAAGQKSENGPPSSGDSSAYHSCEATAHELLCHVNSAGGPKIKQPHRL